MSLETRDAIDRMPPTMLDHAVYYARNNRQGWVGRITGAATAKALLRRGVLGEGVDENGIAGLFLTPLGWSVAQAIAGIDRPADEGRMSLEDALNEAYQPTARTAADFPAGTRVVSEDGRMGTVNGYDIGRVTNADHVNYGREYIGVHWDSENSALGYKDHGPVFVDELRIDLTTSVSPSAARTVDRLTPFMIKALCAIGRGDLAACGAREEKALISRGLIHPTTSELTGMGHEVLRVLADKGLAPELLSPRVPVESKASHRTTDQEIAEMAIRFEDAGMSPKSARAEAERIAGIIAASARRDTLRSLADHYRVKAERAPKYTPPKGGTTSGRVYSGVAEELDRMAEG